MGGEVVTKSESLKVNAIALGLMVLAAYVIYISGTIYCTHTMPDGPLFAGLLTVLGLVFGVKLGPAIIALYNKEAK